MMMVLYNFPYLSKLLKVSYDSQSNKFSHSCTSGSVGCQEMVASNPYLFHHSRSAHCEHETCCDIQLTAKTSDTPTFQFP